MVLFRCRTQPASKAAPKAAKTSRKAATAAADSPQYVTRQELDAAVGAMGAALGCAARAFGETYFRPSDLVANLNSLVAASPPLSRPFLKRLLDAVTTYKEPKRQAEAWHDKFYREATGVSR